MERNDAANLKCSSYNNSRTSVKEQTFRKEREAGGTSSYHTDKINKINHGN
jgi:hypothetical protein